MGSERFYNVAVNELSVYLQMSKIVSQDIIFIHEPRQSKKSPYGYHHWESSYMLSADTNDTIDGLFLHLKSQLIYDEWYHSFALAYRHDRVRNIIRQLEVYPPDYPSHRENGITFFGTHIHEMTHAHQDLPQGHDRYGWHEWIDYFCACTHITIQGKINAPNEGLLL